jgi:hypothetical protein
MKLYQTRYSRFVRLAGFRRGWRNCQIHRHHSVREKGGRRAFIGEVIFRTSRLLYNSSNFNPLNFFE